jgi:hypothetical protein
LKYQHEPTQLDTIESHVGQAVERTERGVLQLEEAAKYQKKSRKKMCILSRVTLFILFFREFATLIITQSLPDERTPSHFFNPPPSRSDAHSGNRDRDGAAVYPQAQARCQGRVTGTVRSVSAHFFSSTQSRHIFKKKRLYILLIFLFARPSLDSVDAPRWRDGPLVELGHQKLAARVDVGRRRRLRCRRLGPPRALRGPDLGRVDPVRVRRRAPGRRQWRPRGGRML